MKAKVHSIIRRRNIVLQQPQMNEDSQYQNVSSALKDCTVLIINSSYEMAKEMTMQLNLGLPGCSIMYAPTLELASLLIRRRKIDLVVSSPLLPDGSVSRLKETFEKLQNPPDVVVIGNVPVNSANAFGNSVYDIAELRRLGREARLNERKDESELKNQKMEKTISSLGADLRNDLNNPLQEIVAMVYVAQSAHGEASPATEQALVAIDKAAKNMARVVGGLEDKIKNVVTRKLEAVS